MPYYPNGTWYNWTQALAKASNSTSPQTALIKSSLGVIPWVFPAITFILYIVLFIAFQNSPGRFKIVGIAAMVLVISFIFTIAGLETAAILNIIVFLLAWFLTGLFKT